MSQATFNVMPTAIVGLRRMVQFAQVFAVPEIVATLSRQLSWSHFVNQLPIKTELARQFYADQAASQTWSVRELRQQIDRKAFERTELASLQAHTTVRAEPVEAIDLILCAESSREQVVLLQVHKDGITVAEYWTELPPKAELEPHLHQALIDARERLARRGCCWMRVRMRDLYARILAPHRLLVEYRLDSGDFDDTTSDKFKVMTMKVSKSLKFSVVTLLGVGHMPAAGENEKEAVRVFHVAATRAPQRLVMGFGVNGGFCARLPHLP
jgi:hypothetical protein